MPYISLDNLMQYNGRLRDYIDGSFDKLDGANWRKTSAGQSVSCWPIPESPLEPEVTFKFSETQPESGTKAPDNPSTIVGVESVSCNVCESEGVDDVPYSIDLGGTYYGGTVNFATGVLEVTHTMYDIGEAVTNYSTSNAVFLFDAPKTSLSSLPDCESFVYHSQTSTFVELPDGQFMPHVAPNPATQTRWIFRASSYSTVDAFKTAFAGKKLVYQLATPITVPLTPVLVRSLPALSHYTPRQNTIYTPHESVQVGYAKSASKTSQDLANAIVALGGNI